MSPTPEEDVRGRLIRLEEKFQSFKERDWPGWRDSIERRLTLMNGYSHGTTGFKRNLLAILALLIALVSLVARLM